MASNCMKVVNSFGDVLLTKFTLPSRKASVSQKELTDPKLKLREGLDFLD